MFQLGALSVASKKSCTFKLWGCFSSGMLGTIAFYCLHSSKPYFFSIPGAETTSQITRGFFSSPPLLISQRLNSPCQPHQNVTRRSSSLKQCAISNSVSLSLFFFYPYRSLVQVPNSVPFCTVPRRQCGTFEKGDIFQQEDCERLRFGSAWNIG